MGYRVHAILATVHHAVHRKRNGKAYHGNLLLIALLLLGGYFAVLQCAGRKYAVVRAVEPVVMRRPAGGADIAMRLQQMEVSCETKSKDNV